MCTPCHQAAAEQRAQDEAVAAANGTRMSTTPYRTTNGGAVVGGVYYEPDED